MMNIDDIKAIMKLMAEYQLTEFSVESEGSNICIRRDNAGIPAVQTAVPVVQSVPVPVAAPVAPAAPAAAAVEAPAPGTPVESPLVGTFYAAPSPDSAPFVQVGDRVTPDTVICIIEAMKVMNEIKAEKSGVVKEIVAQNGQPVEYGQVLIILE
jgi:acetyl-CoA carboxylase biotin carboxyl carrier protein